MKQLQHIKKGHISKFINLDKLVYADETHGYFIKDDGTFKTEDLDVVSLKSLPSYLTKIDNYVINKNHVIVVKGNRVFMKNDTLLMLSNTKALKKAPNEYLIIDDLYFNTDNIDIIDIENKTVNEMSISDIFGPDIDPTEELVITVNTSYEENPYLTVNGEWSMVVRPVEYPESIKININRPTTVGSISIPLSLPGGYDSWAGDENGQVLPAGTKVYIELGGDATMLSILTTKSQYEAGISLPTLNINDLYGVELTSDGSGYIVTAEKHKEPTPPGPGPEPEPTTGTDVDYITVMDGKANAAYNKMSVDINDKVNTQDAVIFYDGINYKPNNDTYYYEDPDVKYCYIEIAVDSHSTSWGENKSVYLPGTGNPWFTPVASFPADGTRIRVYNRIDENRGPITVQTENWVGKDAPIENPPSIDRKYYVDVVYSASEQRYIVVRKVDDSD